MWKDYLKKLKAKMFHPKKILLITNRGSDNCGDQVLEQSDISLIKTVMKNLHVSRLRYTIISRDAGLLRKSYVENRDPKDMEDAKRTISSCDLVLFGGAPMFNHLYQIFYERTALMIEIAQEYGKPVLFSAIGIEAYDETSPKCIRIRDAANLPCVKSITTRDDFEALKKIRQREDLVIDRVPDPAVFCDRIFRRFSMKSSSQREKKRIGVFVLRERGFEDNRMPFTQDQVTELYFGIYQELEQRGYEARFMTSGHFADEATLEKLVTQYGIPRKSCVMCMLTPEQLFSEVSACDGVISCRLHPSIISYSCRIPSVGLQWNDKVTGFYNSVGYSDRMIPVQELTSGHVVDALEEAMKNGVVRDEVYMYRLYTNLFEEIRDSLYPEKKAQKPYAMEELVQRLTPYKGTKDAEKKLKLERKFKRIYEKYNETHMKLRESTCHELHSNENPLGTGPASS